MVLVTLVARAAAVTAYSSASASRPGQLARTRLAARHRHSSVPMAADRHLHRHSPRPTSPTQRDTPIPYHQGQMDWPLLIGTPKRARTAPREVYIAPREPC